MLIGDIMTKQELLIATIESNILMYDLTGTIDYLNNAQIAWKLLKASNKRSKAINRKVA